MNELTEDILAFLTKHRVCALATMLPDGMPHGAALHYSHKNSPFELYVSVDSTNRKCIGLLKGEPVNGTVVIGFSEEEWLTLQMDSKTSLC
jgi:nitroimidazol reductase NimA-like FMN-containing flavoprotein (pyridoxamine 5'-phosphate oxidase superfamily)